MPIVRHLHSILTICILLCASPAMALESFAPVVERALPAVVNISTTQKVQSLSAPTAPGLPQGMEDERRKELEKFLERFGFPLEQMQPENQEVNSLGSGFVIDPDGYVVTNNHVIAQASEIYVLFSDDRKLEATVVGRDPKTDLALLKVTPEKPLAYVQFGNSDAMRVGDWIIAIGNPFGLGSTVTAGIISARSRNINAGPFDDFLQTDAAINRGNSGGPMFNQRGEVIGVNTAIFSPSGGNVGIGFAIPSAMAKPILDQLREHGRAYRGWLGVKIQHVTEEIAESLGLAKPMGALVLEITPDSPAAKASIQPGDIVISFNGKPVKEMRMLPRMVAQTPVGDVVSVSVWREGQRKRIKLTLGEFPQEEQQSQDMPAPAQDQSKPGTLLSGMYLAPLTSADRQKLELKKNVSGVLVTAVEKNSEAAKRGLKQRDVIAGVNQRNIASIDDIKDAIDTARQAGRDYVLLRVIRSGQSNYITLPVNEE